MSTLKKWVGNFGLMSVSIILTLLFLEIILRFTSYVNLLPFSEFPEFYFENDTVKCYDIRKNFSKSIAQVGRNRELLYEIWSNELGCFDTPYNGEGEYAILLGDSFTHAYAPFNDKWGTRIESFLDYRILKCGVTGYGTKQELFKAQEIITQVNHPPKLIIVGYFMNDLQDDNVFKMYLESPFKYRIKLFFRTNSILYNMSRITLKRVLTEIPDFENLIKKTVKKAPFRKNKNTDTAKLPSYAYAAELDNKPWIQQLWGWHLGNLKEFKVLADSVGAKLLVIIIPVNMQVYSFFDRILASENPNKILHEFFKREGIVYFDLLPKFRKFADLTPRKKLDSEKDLYFSVDGHWSIKGNHLAGLLVSKHILENNFLDIANKEGKLEDINEKLKGFH